MRGIAYGPTMEWLNELKVLIESYSGLEKDALHIHLALLLYIVAMAVLRQSRRSRLPWLFVLGVELVNEASDLFIQYGAGDRLDLAGGAKDIWNTMLWPTVLLFIGRYTNLFQHRPHHLRPTNKVN